MKALIERIEILDKYRTAVVRNPRNPKEVRRHGLGVVGEPILGYLGDRIEGYSITLPGVLNVYRIRFTPSGRERKYLVDPAELQAPDLQPR